MAAICPYSNGQMSSQAPRQTRVLFIATDLSTGGGVNKVIRDLAVLFSERLSAEVTVVNARSDRPPSYEFPNNIPIRQGHRGGLIGYFGRLLGLRSLRPDFVFGPWTQDNILIALAFLFSRTKVVLVEHSSWHLHGPLIRLLRRITYPLADVVVVLNRHDLDHYRRYLGNVRLIPNPVPAPATKPAARERLVLAVGHLSPLKNFGDAIRAFAQTGLEAEGWSLAIIGSGSEEPSLRALIAELGLERTSIHAGQEDLAEWYARASLLLVTSQRESFSLVLAEAMLAGVVPLAYASDGPSFILENFPAQLVDMGEVETLATHLKALAGEPDLEPRRQKLAQSIRTRFAPEVVAEQWKKLLAD